MNTYTADLIQKFIESNDVEQLPGIFIQLHEDAAIAQYFIYPDVMRLLRNKAAHEPASLLHALNNSINKNCTIFIVDGERKIHIDWHAVLINMYNVYIHTVDSRFIRLAATLLKVMLISPSPYVVSDMGLNMCNDDIMTATLQIIGESALLRTTNITDNFHSKLLRDEPGKYLRIALPCWLSFISIGVQKVYPVDFYQYLIKVDGLRSQQMI